MRDERTDLREAALRVIERWDSPAWKWGDGPTADLIADLRVALSAEQRVAEVAGPLVEALRTAVRQNSHDMLMTGEELRACEAALAAYKERTVERCKCGYSMPCVQNVPITFCKWRAPAVLG